MKKNRGIPILLLLGLLGVIFLYFFEALIQSKLMVERDLPIFFFPNLKLWVEAVKAGELPLWNPYSFSGQPLFASLQTSILYPPNGLLLILPIRFAFNLTIILHFFLSGWFVYLLCREIGGSRVAGVLACLSFTLGGFLLSIHNVLNTLQSVTWTPLIFFFFLRALRNQSWKFPLLCTITILVQFLGGGIEAFLLTQVLVLFLAFCPQSLLPEGHYVSWKWRLGTVFLIYLLFFGLGAVQIFPFWEMARNSIRQFGFSYQEATMWSLGWMDFIYVFIPDFFWRGNEYYQTDQNFLKSIYLGIIPFMMVLFYFLGKDRRRIWFGLFIGVSLLLALGKNTPLYQWLYSIVPGLNTIRYPVKIFFITNLFICLLTGLGWDALSERLAGDPRKKLLLFKKCSLISAFFFVLILLIFSLFRSPLLAFLEHSFPISYARPWGLNLHNLERFFFFALLIFLFSVFLADRKISIKWGQPILILLLTLDLFLANWGFYRMVDQKTFYSLSPNLQAVLSDPEKGRIYVDPVMIKTKTTQKVRLEELAYLILKECFYFDYPLIHQIYNASGFGVMTYRPYQDLLTVLKEKASHPRTTDILRLMHVKYFLWHKAIEDPDLKLIRKGESYDVVPEGLPGTTMLQVPQYQKVTSHLYEDKAVLARTFLVSKYLVVKNGKERMDLFKKKGFDPAQTVLLEEVPVPPRPTKGLVPPIDEVRLGKFTLNQMDLHVSCSGPRLLFLSETYYPGWKVWVDGKRETIYRANHAFRAVGLSPGRHSVVFKYQPFSFYFGLSVSFLTLIGLIVGLFWLRKNNGYKESHNRTNINGMDSPVSSTGQA
ncbi:MAG: hypothetical protein C0407_07695 [Desulfobacca sp.]|nr:hypothetical protein [Desulfobacca sp.]